MPKPSNGARAVSATRWIAKSSGSERKHQSGESCLGMPWYDCPNILIFLAALMPSGCSDDVARASDSKTTHGKIAMHIARHLAGSGEVGTGEWWHVSRMVPPAHPQWRMLRAAG